MATHTKEDIDKLMTAIEEIWDEHKQQNYSEYTFLTSNKALMN